MKSMRPLHCLRRGSLLLISFLLLAAGVGVTNSYGQSASCDGCDANPAPGATCNAGVSTLPLESACERWETLKCRLEEECGIEFEGSFSNFFQGVSSGGLQRKFR